MNLLFGTTIHGYAVILIFWNVALSLIPCFTVYHLLKSDSSKPWRKLIIKNRVAFIVLFLFWFFFFPNTAYLFTIPRHLVNYCSNFNVFRVCKEGTWMVFFFFTYAALGIPTFYYALKKMSLVLETVFNKMLSKIFPVIMIPLASFGLLFGLFERFNTWDVLRKPVFILSTAFGYLGDVRDLFNIVFFSVVLYIIYYGTDIFVWKILKK